MVGNGFTAQTAPQIWARRAARAIVPAAILLFCGWVLSQKLSVELLLSLPERLGDIAPWQWLCAAVLTTLSLYSVGRYDVLAHRFLRTGLPERNARWTGSIAIAVGQALGFGLFTGALARWRMMPALGPVKAFRLSVFVSISFIIAWVVVTSVVSLVLPAPTWAKWVAALGCACAYIGMIALFFCPELRIRSLRLRLPGWRLSGGILFWAFVDTLAAAGALYVMLPAGTVGFATFYPVFLIAMGAALLSNTPGGLGPFEVIMLSILPGVGIDVALTAILGYRIVYYAIPAGLAALALIRPFHDARPRRPFLRSSIATAPRSEVGVVRQNGGALHDFGNTSLALWPTGQTMTLVADPLSGKVEHGLGMLMERARDTAAIPMVYKGGARLAATARRAGWSVLHIADDAIVPLDRFDVNTPERRTLRRKLRAADRVGVELCVDQPLPHKDLAYIDAHWQDQHGRARGGSMGRYCPNYMVDQWVAVARINTRCVAFVTAHMARDEWCLDLMRHTDDAPDGTMHALVHAAIEAAQAQGAKRFCLAATPACPDPGSAFWRWAMMQFVQVAGGVGLRQFKSNFGPVWRPRYAASTTPYGLFIGLADILRTIQFPGPVTTATTNAAHDLDENYEVASHRAA
ncbi:phosphatidylglycerol lysyltransferase domain-containing protein [uncultured Tateyamaria sp.]|uniref:phosphatidylglycerol lysyltransferase domain-containing protein n=1 Tax=Tateyamaria sp. 1078 TaxID=3417464 RepID=UPI00263A04CF|nr:phosphatidylglycerol lysyltransferase domain-containing protein [uncultured Tateyamaria sp.]